MRTMLKVSLLGFSGLALALSCTSEDPVLVSHDGSALSGVDAAGAGGTGGTGSGGTGASGGGGTGGTGGPGGSDAGAKDAGAPDDASTACGPQGGSCKPGMTCTTPCPSPGGCSCNAKGAWECFASDRFCPSTDAANPAGPQPAGSSACGPAGVICDATLPSCRYCDSTGGSWSCDCPYNLSGPFVCRASDSPCPTGPACGDRICLVGEMCVESTKTGGGQKASTSDTCLPMPASCGGTPTCACAEGACNSLLLGSAAITCDGVSNGRLKCSGQRP